MDNENNQAQEQEEVTGIKISEFPAASTLSESDTVTGLQAGGNVRFTMSSILSWIALKLSNAFVSASRTINGKSLSSDVTLTATDVGARPNTWTPSAADVGAQDKITASGILKGDGAGGVSAATPGTDYQAPLTAGTDYATPAQLADKAAKADLTNIQATGTTNNTGAAIPAGAYFYLNGVLHRAKTQIDVNATFTPGTNCETYTVGDALDQIQKVSTSGRWSKQGNIVIYNANTWTTASSTTIPAGYRPKTTVFAYAEAKTGSGTSGTPTRVTFNSDGSIVLASETMFIGTFIWITD